jgi:hypothetical protein
MGIKAKNNAKNELSAVTDKLTKSVIRKTFRKFDRIKVIGTKAQKIHRR